MLNAALRDVAENVDRRMGRHAWMLPWMVAAGAYLVNKKLKNRSTMQALMASALVATSTAGLVAAGKNMEPAGK